MPTISRFYGIVVYMNYNDHDPPHFHARYQDSEMLVEINSNAVTGSLPKRAMQMVLEWSKAHRQELIENWNRARQRQSLEQIPPLD